MLQGIVLSFWGGGERVSGGSTKVCCDNSSNQQWDGLLLPQLTHSVTPSRPPPHLISSVYNPRPPTTHQDRVHRLGQTRPVFVWRYVARGTIEERMLEMQVRAAAKP